MDFLNTASVQVRELFRSMTPGARLTTGLLLAILVVSFGYLANHQISGPDAFLMGGEPFSAAQIPAMEAAFSEAQLTDYSIDGNRIRVPRGTQAAYMGALADAGALPPNFGSYLESAIRTGGVFESDQQRKRKDKVALQSELALILRSMQGVENASVLYDVQKGVGLDRGKDTVTATVSIKPTGSRPLDPSQVPMIRHLVAGAIAGLKPSNVTVADLSGRHYPGGGDQGTIAVDASEDPYYARQQMYERRLKEKIIQALRFIPGVDVQVTANLSRDLRNVVKQTDYKPRAVIIESKADTTTFKTINTRPSGRPGVLAEGPGEGLTILSAALSTTNDEERIQERQRRAVRTMHTEREVIGLIPQSVRVTVGIPSNYYTQVWYEQNKPADGEEAKKPEAKELEDLESKTKDKIQNAIVPLLPPVDAGEDPFSHVAVTTYPSLTPEPLTEPSFSQNAMSWAGQYGSTFAMMGLALFSLLVLRSIVRSLPPPERTPTGQPKLSLLAEDEGSQEVEGIASNEESVDHLKRRIAKGPNLKDDLSEIVQEDPEAAANILRAWISNAS